MRLPICLCEPEVHPDNRNLLYRTPCDLRYDICINSRCLPTYSKMGDDVGASTLVVVEHIGQQTSPLRSLIYFLFALTTLPYRRAFNSYTWKPIQAIRAANGDRKLLMPLVKEWKADKYDELQAVQVAATFCGCAVLSSLPWTRAEQAHWIADALWFSSLILSIFAIITSVQTKSMLDDLPSREQLSSSLPEYEVHRIGRAILRYKRTPGLKHYVMLFIWQFPSMTMAYAWMFYIAGLTVGLCSPFIQKLPWQNRHKVAIAYLSFALVGLITYVSATIFVYAGEKDYERSVANSRNSTMARPREGTKSNENVQTCLGEPGDKLYTLGTSNEGYTDITRGSTVEPEPVQTTRAKIQLGLVRTRISEMDSTRPKRSLLYW
ncbi:hypothetical protein DE146DRAFT_435786 [Phaeosphaeria sp. MPI-PUGE-AT-0046c]|nr:hypothetical protein DE146DRAFT_435786 [Phaeosphaeria sp. MPI-PUGE-AT-0046c]